MKESTRSLQRLIPRLQRRFAGEIAARPSDWNGFLQRLEVHFERLFGLLLSLYGDRYDFFFHLEELLAVLLASWMERSAELKVLDQAREAKPDWFQSNHMLGGMCYVDLFAGNLQGVRERIPYLKELGLTYLHLMPLFKAPEGANDGGYAVSSYREVDPKLGTIAELRLLASDLRREGISLVLDFVFNHTSDQHEWAFRALDGDPEYQEFYRIFPDRTLPDAYEAHLREIFPDEHSGAFTFSPRLGQWVWTTFHNYQWDLNYANPAVFNQMTSEMLFLANAGVEVLRLDAVAFLWKQLGTSCENLPQAHDLIQAFNAAARIAAPALIFKSEAIVHPDEVIKYIRPDECQISYNPLVMALLWNTLATREVNLLKQGLQERFKLPNGCAWVNYVRSHDDIGWTFSDEDAAHFGINGYDHRQFLNAFYTGQFPGSFGRGLPFQYNPKTGDMRISGSCASLAGLEKGLRERDAVETELAIRRILLIHAVILTLGGIPLIYLGDELGTLNDYSYLNDPVKAGDSRWVHRPYFEAQRAAQRFNPESLEGRIFRGLRHLIELRKTHEAFGEGSLQVIEVDNPHVLGYVRVSRQQRIMMLANFSEREQIIAANLLRLQGLGYKSVDLLTGEQLSYADLRLEGCSVRCLEGR